MIGVFHKPTPNEIKYIMDDPYSSLDNGFIQNLFGDRLFTFICDLIPNWVSANLISIIGFLIATLSHMISISIFLNQSHEIETFFSEKNNFSNFARNYNSNSFPLSFSHFVLLLFPSIFVLVCDNLDGKQARRTKTDTAFGELLDHVFDSVYGICLMTNMVFLLGCLNRSFLIMNILLLNFSFVLTKLNYCLKGYYQFDFFGTNEGQAFFFLLILKCYFHRKVSVQVFDINNLLVLALPIFLYLMNYNLLKEIYKSIMKGKSKKVEKSILYVLRFSIVLYLCLYVNSFSLENDIKFFSLFGNFLAIGSNFISSLILMKKVRDFKAEFLRKNLILKINIFILVLCFLFKKYYQVYVILNCLGIILNLGQTLIYFTKLSKSNKVKFLWI